MKTPLRLLCVVAATSLVASCGSGGGTVNDTSYTSYAAIAGDKTLLDGDYATASDTAYANLPAIGTGSVTYDGFVGGTVSSGDIIGQLSLTADFDAPDVIDGRAYNFLRDDSSAIVGELTLDSGGILDNAGSAEVSATLSGDLDGVMSSLSLNGDFVADADAIKGTALGGGAGSPLDGFNGDFIAEVTP